MSRNKEPLTELNTMRHLINKTNGAIKNDVYSLIKYDYTGIIGVEAATSYWGLSTFNPGMPILLFDDKNAKDESGLFVESSLSFLFVPNVNMNNLVKLSDNLRITDPEQTVCDMVRYTRHEFHLFETLISAYSGMVDMKRLTTLAKQYNILDKMQRLYEEALEVEEEG